ncbi:efflux RND transporter permease subunit [Methylophilus sp. OH31]|uniref:efflux RND transporter permease subunit n=1 Tax=Methylophilus sp. OH31 TaxID=1387312 RepID=UPI0004655E86|nr:efflux RND transporter permease subunit [Methylophilus sp. OH31]
MLKRFTMRAIQARYLVIVLAVLLMLAGFKTIPNTPMDVFPEFAPVKVEIQTEAPGLSSVETEQLVSIPIEHAMNGIPHMKTLRSKSVLGLSSVVMLFEQGTSLAEARQAVQERLLLAAQRLPAIVKPPVMLSPLSSMSRVLKIGLSSTQYNIAELSTKALWTVRPRLMAIPGVANVAIWGLRDQELHVRFNPVKLTQHQLTATQVSQRLASAIRPDSGGYLDTAQQRLAVAYDRPTLDKEDYLQMTVGLSNGIPVKLGQVAEVDWAHALPIGDAVINQGDGLLLIVEKHPDANTLSVTRQIDQALTELTPALHGVNVDAAIFRPATFIEQALHHLNQALVLGIGLVAIILFLFLRKPRAAIISLVAIPLSLVTAMLLLTWLNVSINTMVLAGLVIALGEVVDDSIIDLENILRAMALNQQQLQPKPLIKVIAQASYEVRGSVIYATLIVMSVFIPVFFLQGVAGAFFKPLAYGYLLAISASLLVALIVTPVLAYCFLKQMPPQTEHALRLPHRMEQWLASRLAKPKMVLASACLFLFGTLATLPFLGTEFLPAFKETDFLMHFVARPGTSITEMKTMSLRASHELMQIDGVRNLGAHIGRAEVADEVVGPNFGELWVSISPTVNYADTMQKINQAIAGYSGIFTDVQTYLKERTKEVMSGNSASIVIRLFGDDLDSLREEAEQIRQTIADINGLTDLKVESQVLIPRIHVRLKNTAADHYGVTEADIKQALALMTQGQVQGEVTVGQARFNVRLIGDSPAQDSVQALRQIAIQSPAGAVITLADVAEVYVQATPNEIKREGASRKIDISANVAGNDIGSVAKEVEARINRLKLPEGNYVKFMGEYTEQKTATLTLVIYTLLALLVVFLLIWMSLKSMRLTALLFAVLPVAVAGGLIGIWFIGGVMSLGAMIGLIAVMGIAARNGILLISRYQQLRLTDGITTPRLLLNAVSDRFRAISMTTLATTMALLPIILKGPVSGYEIEHPLAVVVFCGLLAAMVVNLVLLPALILIFHPGEHPH